MGKGSFGINQEACYSVATSLKKLQDTELEVALVIGGGNIFRGIHLTTSGIKRTPADHMGMLATMINGIALKDALQALGCKVRVMSALDCPKVVESYNWEKAQEALQGGTILIFVGGTSNPYFTTDTAAALRANEIEADILLKATKVDGIFNKDPQKNPDATKYDMMSYSQVLNEKLEVMDATAIALCRKNKLPILVFNMETLMNHQLLDLLQNPEKGTLVTSE